MEYFFTIREYYREYVSIFRCVNEIISQPMHIIVSIYASLT